MTMKPSNYQPLFAPGRDVSEYFLLTPDFVGLKKIAGRQVLEVRPEALALLAQRAFEDVSFYLRTSHLEKLARILKDSEASENDRYVAWTLLRNSVAAAEGVLPTCQDTGTAAVFARKGEAVWTGADDEAVLAQGIYETFQKKNLRYSQLAPLGMFEEANTGTNLPAQIEIHAVGGAEYDFLFLAKGGGSANKTFLFQESPSVLNEAALTGFFQEKLRLLGTSACPPYHIAAVVGGLSPEMTLKTVKLAAAGYYDGLPSRGSAGGQAFRDEEWERKIFELARKVGWGAQFGGKYFAHDVRVIRLPRHAASCPVGLGVSCSADRNIRGKITADGVFLEKLEKNPARFLPGAAGQTFAQPVRIDLDRSMPEILKQLSSHPAGTRLSLDGTLVVARDAVHARIQKMLDDGRAVPEYFKSHPIYYAGPAKTPDGMPTGSFGPTTAGRMDAYADALMKNGISLISLAKGNRSDAVRQACARYHGFYLGTIGGSAAILAKENIVSSEVIDFEDLGMEAVRRIRVKDFPALIVLDDKGNNFFGAADGQAEI